MALKVVLSLLRALDVVLLSVCFIHLIEFQKRSHGIILIRHVSCPLLIAYCLAARASFGCHNIIERIEICTRVLWPVYSCEFCREAGVPWCST